MRKINTVIFDLGRVLLTLDWRGENFGRLMRAFGIMPEKAFDKYWFRPEVRQHMTGEISSREFYEIARASMLDGHNYDYEQFVEGWNDLFHPVPGMERLFDEVARRHQVGILSDTDPLHWHRALEILPWLKKVEKPTLSYEVKVLKPHPEMYMAAAANCGRPRDECLFIDDRQENVDGARMTGMPGLLFMNPEKLRKDLVGLGVL